MVTALYGALGVALAVLLAMGGLALVQHLVPWQLRQRHNDVAGFIFAVLGVVYAVLLGFTTVVVWEDFNVARSTTESEANELAQLFWLGRELPEPEGGQVQDLARSYARVVVDEEWRLMQHGQSSQRAWAIVDELQSVVYGFKPDTGREEVLYAQGLTLVHDLLDQRRLRLLEAKLAIPRVLWGVLVIGGIIVVGFTYLFGLEKTTSHTIMIASLSATIALALFTIYALDRPFAGISRVEPESFELVLESFKPGS